MAASSMDVTPRHSSCENSPDLGVVRAVMSLPLALHRRGPPAGSQAGPTSRSVTTVPEPARGCGEGRCAQPRGLEAPGSPPGKPPRGAVPSASRPPGPTCQVAPSPAGGPPARVPAARAPYRLRTRPAPPATPDGLGWKPQPGAPRRTVAPQPPAMATASHAAVRHRAFRRKRHATSRGPRPRGSDVSGFRARAGAGGCARRRFLRTAPKSRARCGRGPGRPGSDLVRDGAGAPRK